ncbi:hypothetical protein TESG_08416 [Trichophyton tonsurans CBS 112818]|uniref:Uncharacterized protein n=1 Tax=Trichophyton tonsurans (strain CBS 112818) TaxID=647933 RepID=F2RXD5_TRIT1|nr:hypothetical protein TESG_08416 [Trichophyton tonsurans CBS 112818]
MPADHGGVTNSPEMKKVKQCPRISLWILKEGKDTCMEQLIRRVEKYLKQTRINGKSSDSSLVTALLPASFLQVSVCHSRDEGDIGRLGRDNEHEQRIPGLPA